MRDDDTDTGVFFLVDDFPAIDLLDDLRRELCTESGSGTAAASLPRGVFLSDFVRFAEDPDRGELDRGERDRGEFDRGELDRGELDRGEFDRGERDRGELDRGEFARERAGVDLSRFFAEPPRTGVATLAAARASRGLIAGG